MQNAIFVRNATIKELERFLWMFYNEKYDDYSEASVEDWFTILRLSHDWGFEDIKSVALRYIKSKESEMTGDLVDRIMLYENHSLPKDTLVPLYMRLCVRNEFPTDEECEKLGPLCARAVQRAREELLRAFRGEMPTKKSDRTETLKAKGIIIEALNLKEPLSGSGAPETQTQAGSSSTATAPSANGSNGKPRGPSLTGDSSGTAASTSSSNPKGPQNVWSQRG
ncbi:hypothetical protein D9611_006960 [Ephemerocybe angulata]|uniref:Uncharacterized protein n=1 Tax=Ephemerocybe angulata TaxID=980116 RepID=A0A8H5B0Z1_9AGAR|nr:hypothetical protein D9611_006960 [Tulosesus angulatus]